MSGASLTQRTGTSTGWAAGWAAGACPPCHPSVTGSRRSWQGGDGRCIVLPCRCSGRYEASIPRGAAAQATQLTGESPLYPAPGRAETFKAARSCNVSWHRFNALLGTAPAAAKPQPSGMRLGEALQDPHPGQEGTVSSLGGGRVVHRACRGQFGAGLGCGSHTLSARRREVVLPTQAVIMGGQGQDLEDLTLSLIKVPPHSTAASLAGPGTQP